MSNLTVFNKSLTNEKTQEYLKTVLGERKNSFVNNLTALVANNVALQACEFTTLMYAAIKATALDLPLDSNLGFAYVIPFKNNSKGGITEAQFQIGFKGFIQLALRSGQFERINVRDVREGEIIDEDFISGENIYKRLKENREQAPIIGYVAFFKLNNGFSKSLYMTLEEVNIHAKRFSKTFNSSSSVWKSDFDAMAEKTVIKRLFSKYAPLSVEMQSAISVDQAVIREENRIDYPDSPIYEITEQANQLGTDILAEALITEESNE